MIANCTSCGAPLSSKTAEATGGWDMAPGGDEFWDVLHCCADCGVWSMVTHCEPFVGPHEINVTGPLSQMELTQQRQRILASHA